MKRRPARKWVSWPFGSFSRYGLIATKCLDQQCCKPYRSPILTILRHRRLPPPQVIVNKNGCFELGNPDHPAPIEHFASLLSTTHLQLLDPETPMEYFCTSQRTKILQQTCPDCKMYFPNKTHMLNHKRALHKYSRSKLDEEFLEDFKDVSQQVSFIAGRDGDQYLCVMRDGSIDYQSLPENHEKVAYFKRVMQKKYSCEIIENVQNWVAS